MTNLKDINFGINQYCGPAVLSALTGESTDRCAAVISSVSGRKEIKAVQIEHLKEALKRLRFSVTEQAGGSTLWGVLFRLHHEDGMYIIGVPGHVVAVEVNCHEIYICDNHTKVPIDIKQSARLTQKVNLVLKVSAKEAPKFINSEIRLSKTSQRIDIYNVNKYESSEDNTEYSLGFIKFKSKAEIKLIVDALGKVMDEY